MHNPWTKEGILEGMGVLGGRGVKRKNWDNHNSIINKMYFKNK